MANSKNTIQNIPLEAELCMNALKTEVKPFKGYNEKNTTFYGGTLSPIYDKTTELFDKDNSYTFFNSKGEAFTLVKEDDEIHLYKGSERFSVIKGRYLCKTEKLKVPPYTVGAAKIPNGDLITVIQDKDELGRNNQYKIYKNGVELDLDDASSGNSVKDVRFWRDNSTSGEDLLYIGVVTDGGSTSAHARIFCYSLLDDYTLLAHSTSRSVDNVSEPLLTGGANGFYFINKSGKIKNPEVKGFSTFYNKETMTFSNWVAHDNYVEIEDTKKSGVDLYGYTIFNGDNTTAEIQQCCSRSTTSVGYENLWKLKVAPDSGVKSNFYATDTDGFIPTPINSFLNGADVSSTYWQGGHLISITDLGRPIDECLGYGKDTFSRLQAPDCIVINYTKKDGSWYAYTRSNVTSISTDVKDYLKNCVIDGRYVFTNVYTDSVIIFDIETEQIRPENNLGWILSISPSFPLVGGITVNPNPAGIVFAAGVNAGYTVNNSPFVGYLPNPFIGYNFNGYATNVIDFKFTGYDFGGIQTYYTIGDTAQAAVYKGSDPEYEGTLYPIDPNGNVVLPISQNAEIIKGHSNNNLVKEGNTVYPLMYWNTNQKTYSYMLLSSMENVTDVFSLQGQQYAVDDENIYAINFNSGVISNVNAVAYKKNLTFLGTLPTQAVFWSEFNKTFYAFTGDRTLSRMFEASDINKIHFVGQNPSSLSLWICSDSGVYILSDSDMYKLDFESKQVAFQPKTALVVTEGETNNECHAISLYLNENEEGEMIPVKLQTAYYGLGGEMKAVMDCWYIRLFDKDRTEGYVKVKVNTITDVTRHTEEKTFKVNPSDYDDNNIFYLRYQPKYQECVSMQLELETNLGIYSLSLGVNTTDSTAQVSKFNF